MAVNHNTTRLFGMLACPLCRSDLERSHENVLCKGCGTLFPTLGDVPVLVSPGDHVERKSLPARVQYWLLGNPKVYDFQQVHFGAQPVVERLRGTLKDVRNETVLDVGAGTGVIAGLLPSTSNYIWLDNDELKLRGFLTKHNGGFAVMGDAARLPLHGRIADKTFIVEVSHHLPDAAFRDCVAEAARVTKGHLIFIDALWGSRWRSKLMWQLDLGRHPRPQRAILDILETAFEIRTVDRFHGVNHDHVMCVCVPNDLA